MGDFKDLKSLKLSNSTLTSINLEESTMHACTLAKLAIKNSTITASVLTNCHIRSSVLKLSCSIENSKLYECKIFNMKEIKESELHECELSFEREREMREDVLFAALRGHGDIYQEALEAFQKPNSFPFQYGDGQMFKVLPSRVAGTIRKITVIVDDHGHGIAGSVRATIPDMIDNTFQRCKMLTEVERDYGSLSRRHIRCKLFLAVEAILEQCKTLKTLTATGNLPEISQGIAIPADQRQQLVFIREISDGLSVDATQVYGLVSGKVSLV